MWIHMGKLAMTILAGGSIITAWWYMNLTPAQKERAKQLAKQFAWELYQRAFEELTYAQSSAVNDRVREYFERQCG